MSWPMSGGAAGDPWSSAAPGGMGMMPAIPAGYSAEQWAAAQQQNWQQWAQWQQQYNQWQTQYGDKFAQQMQMSGVAGMAPGMMPGMMPGMTPDMTPGIGMPGLPPMPAAAQPPAPSQPPAQPPPPPHENNQPLYNPTTPSTIPAPSSAPPSAPSSAPSSAPKPAQGYGNPTGTNFPDVINEDALKKLAEEERLFDIQFQKWEEEIEKWKRENVNHPDKQAYKEYEQKFESCRAQLMERRKQMDARKARLLGAAGNIPLPPATTPTQPPLPQQQTYPNRPPFPNQNQQPNLPQHNQQNFPQNNPPNFPEQSPNQQNFPQKNPPNFPQQPPNYPQQPPNFQQGNQNQNFNQSQYRNPAPNNFQANQQNKPEPPKQNHNRQDNKNKNMDPQERYDAMENYSQDSGKFLPSNAGGKGIPGLDLVPDDKGAAQNLPPVIDITGDGPSGVPSALSTISQGINNILGDEKIMNILSMVRGQGPGDQNEPPMPPGGHNMPPGGRMPPNNQNMPPGMQNMPPNNQNMPPNNLNMLPGWQNMPPNHHMPPAGYNMPPNIHVPPGHNIPIQNINNQYQWDHNQFDRLANQNPPFNRQPNHDGPNRMYDDGSNYNQYECQMPRNQMGQASSGPQSLMTQRPLEQGLNQMGQTSNGPQPLMAQRPLEQGFNQMGQASNGPPPLMAKRPLEQGFNQMGQVSNGPPPLMAQRPLEQGFNQMGQASNGPPPLMAQRPLEQGFNQMGQASSGPQPLMAQRPLEHLEQGFSRRSAAEPMNQAPPWVEDPMFTPSIIVDYEHKPLRLKARDFIEPVHMFDYNHISKEDEYKKNDFEKEAEDLFVHQPWHQEEDRLHHERNYFREKEPERNYERRPLREEIRELDVPYGRRPPDPYEERRRQSRFEEKRVSRFEPLAEERRPSRFEERREDPYRREEPRREEFTRREDPKREEFTRREEPKREEYSRRDEFARQDDHRRDEYNRRDDRREDYSRRDDDRGRERAREDPHHSNSRSHSVDSRKRALSKESDNLSANSKKAKDASSTKKTEPQQVVMIDDILEHPGREMRPEKIVIIMRGPPGSGKSYLAKLIRDREAALGGAVRIMSIDDYFMLESEVTERDPTTGKMVKKPTLKYEYDEKLEETYLNSLKRAFKRSITDGYFSFLIYDAVNDQLKSYADIWNFARQNNFQVYVCTMELDAATCHARNIHGRSLDDLQVICARWFPTPAHHLSLDPTSLLQAAAIEDVTMEDASNDGVEEVVQVENTFTSKWEKMDDASQLARLDGTSRPLRPSQLSMTDYLQLDDWAPTKHTPGKKTVRWADIEERREQERARAIGFVVGGTDWGRMTDPGRAANALTKTKYIERVRR